MQRTQTSTGTSPAALLLTVGRTIKNRIEKELPLPFSQCEVLRVVADMDNPSMSDLADRFKIAAPSVTTLVEPLVREKYIVRNADKSDRRQVRVSITPKGIAAKAAIEKGRATAIESMLSGLNEKDLKDLKRILNKIIALTS